MIMPSYTTLPESMLGDSALDAKMAFQSSTLAGLRGLGCDCSDTDSEGVCYDPEPCSTGSSTVTAPVITGSGSGSSLPSYTCADGGLVTDPSFCAENIPGSGGSSSGLTAGQTSAIISAAGQIGKIAAAGATGATVLANGTVIGSQSTSLAAGIASVFSNPMMLLLIAGVVAFALVEKH